MIYDRMDRLSGNLSADYTAVVTIKTLAILFMIILTVQCVFHTLCFFCLFCGYFALIVSSVYMILVNALVIIVWVAFGERVSDVLEQLKKLFDSLCTIICNQKRMIFDRIDRLRGHFSVGYVVLEPIKTVAIVFMIILIVQGVFQLLCYFCVLCGCFALILSSVYMILEDMWVIFVLVFLGDNDFNVVEQPKTLFAFLFTIIRSQTKRIHDRVDSLRGCSSADCAAVAAIKIFAIFVIILTVQCVFHLLCYFCVFYGYFAVVSGASITLVKVWVIFEWVLCFIWKLFPEPIKPILCCLSSTTLRGVVTVVSSFSDWALNLRIDWRSFWQLCSLCGIAIIVMLWIKHGTRVICGKVSRGVREVKRLLDYVFAVCSDHGRIILRLSGRCDAKMTVIIIAVIFFAFTFTYVSIFPSGHSYWSIFTHPFHLTGTYLVRVWDNMVVRLDNIRLFVSTIFQPLTNITDSFWKWMALLSGDEAAQVCQICLFVDSLKFIAFRTPRLITFRDCRVHNCM